MRNDFDIWAALTLLAAGIAIAVLFQSSLARFSIGAVVVILLLALRDNRKGANRLDEASAFTTEAASL